MTTAKTVTINEKQVKAMAKAVANTQLSYMQALDVIADKLGFTCFNALKSVISSESKGKKNLINKVTSDNLEDWLHQEYPQFNLMNYESEKGVMTLKSKQVSGTTDNFSFESDAITCFKEWLVDYLDSQELESISSNVLKTLITSYLNDKEKNEEDDLDLASVLHNFFLDFHVHDEYAYGYYIMLNEFLSAKRIDESTIIINNDSNRSTSDTSLHLTFLHTVK